MSRPVQALNRVIALLAVAVAIGSLFVVPTSTLGWAFDIAIRTYATFVASVMAHEAVHGHLGRRRVSNAFGRLALVPACVPFVSFRRTHVMHHAHTNEASRDPDLFLKAPYTALTLLRCVLLPHSWIFWLRRHRPLRQKQLIEIGVSYALMITLYLALGTHVGFWRVGLGMTASLVLASILSWYPFGVLTHEGFSTGGPETRSHDFFGYPLFWITLGCSLHRAHHQNPRRSWLELLPMVRRAPTATLGFLSRDIRS
ncbi:MAG: fatty acid desaturase [Deltaproteobacteria bacterium]|nr:fatty acid desaturase [Deltaproteobacteria bacterium]